MHARLKTIPIWLIIGLCLTFVLTSCRERPIVQLPKGEQTVTGLIRAAPLSLTRRGTHVVVRDGKEWFFAESSGVTLSQFEGQEVTLTGVFELNIDPHDLPVLVVMKVKSQSAAMRGVFLQDLRVRIDVPESWTLEKKQSSVTFTALRSTRPILTVALSLLTSLPVGSSVIVGGERGSRVILGGSNAQVIYVQQDARILSFTFTPVESDVLNAPALFLKILRSVKFEEQATSEVGNPAGTGSVLPHGQPCGGAAGILCPTDAYCSITDAVSNTGICVQRTR